MKSKESLQPFADKIIVRPDAPEGVTPGGIHLPDTALANKRIRRGKIIAVGEGRLTDEKQLMPMRVKEGQSVIFNDYAGSKVEHGGEELLVITEQDILATVGGPS